MEEGKSGKKGSSKAVLSPEKFQGRGGGGGGGGGRCYVLGSLVGCAVNNAAVRGLGLH